MAELGQLSVEARRFGKALGSGHLTPNHLFVVGTPEWEPWHFVAHLDEQATRYGRKDLVPALLRWKIPPGAPPHLALSVDDMAHASQRHTFLVLSSASEAPDLLERVSDAKSMGARIMSLHRGDDELLDLSHETLFVDPSRGERAFEITQHVVTDSAPAVLPDRRSRWTRPLRFR
jgi:hypothetical protein